MESHEDALHDAEIACKLRPMGFKVSVGWEGWEGVVLWTETGRKDCLPHSEQGEGSSEEPGGPLTKGDLGICKGAGFLPNLIFH